MQAFVQLCTQRAAAGPLLVMVEDVHWADEASLAALRALARRLRTLPLLLLATARGEDADASLATWRATLDRDRPAQRLPLGRLDAGELSVAPAHPQRLPLGAAPPD